jgi:hypothetical protein
MRGKACLALLSQLGLALKQGVEREGASLTVVVRSQYYGGIPAPENWVLKTDSSLYKLMACGIASHLSKANGNFLITS